MTDQRKQAVSIRLSEGDLKNVKRMAQRLGVRDSDIVRYAIKSILTRVAPLCDESVRGRNLLPVLIESGDELIRYFELDSYRLESIINDTAEESMRVARDDIALLAMNSLREDYLLMKMQEAHGMSPESPSRARSLRSYLYDKYVYRNEAPLLAEQGDATTDKKQTAQRPAA